MLCYVHSNNNIGDICTNRCQHYSDCEKRNSPSYMKIPFLVESDDRFIKEIIPEVIDGIPVLRYKQYAIAPQATENGFSEETSPTYKKDIETGEYIITPSFYSNLMVKNG